jgi:hypothetical protein
MDDLSAAVALAKSHNWIPLTAVVVAALIRVAKSDRAVAWFPVAVSPRWRAWAALLLGVALGVLQKLATGGTWLEAIVGGLVAGQVAISGHELVVEGLRKGRDIGVAKEPPPPPGTVPPPPKPLSLKPPPVSLPPSSLESLRPPPLPPVRFAVLALVCAGSCVPPADAAYVEQARDLTAASIACRAKGLATIRRGGTCDEKRKRLEQLDEFDPDCLAVASDGGPEHFLCRDAGAELGDASELWPNARTK